MKKISLVVVNYNNSDCSTKMIESLKHEAHLLDEIIIVDNHSEDSELTKLDQYIATLTSDMRNRIVVVASKKNIGYFPGLNLGLRKLMVKERVVIANNDIEFQEGFFQTLCSDKFENEVFAICPDVETVDGYHQNPHVVRKFTWLKKIFFDLYYSNYYIGKSILAFKRLVAKKQGTHIEGEFPIHLGIGACYCLTEHFFQKFSQLDYPSFLYGEEAFLSHQIHEAGGILVYNSKYKIVHMESVATSKIPSKKKYNMTQHSYKMYKNYL